MSSTKLWLASVLAVLLFPLAARAQTRPEKPVDDLRQEAAKLQHLASSISVRLDAIDRRLSQLEQKVAAPAKPQPAKPVVRHAPSPSVAEACDGELDHVRMQLAAQYIAAGDVQKALIAANKVKNRRDLVVFLLHNSLGRPEVLDYIDRELAGKNQDGASSTVTPSGKAPITVHAENLDVQKVLEIIGRQARMNILVSPQVHGTVTLDVRDKTVDEVLQAIATLCHLEIQRANGFVYVTTPGEALAREEADLPVRVYRTSCTKAIDLEKMVKPLLSKRGTISSLTENKNDLVVVKDYERVLKTVDRVIAQIDTPPRHEAASKRR
jgi:hypothetical protein